MTSLLGHACDGLAGDEPRHRARFYRGELLLHLSQLLLREGDALLQLLHPGVRCADLLSHSCHLGLNRLLLGLALFAYSRQRLLVHHNFLRP